MATKTQYYNLDKPSYDEVADIEVINANFDKIDQQMRNNADGVNFAKAISSDAYDNSKLYAVGDYCIYDNKLYRCITAIESAEAFNIAKWKQTTVGREVKQLNSNLVESADYLVPKKLNDSSSVINGYVDMGEFYLDGSFGTVCVPCEKGKTYVITKKQGKRFAVGTCKTIPTTGTIINNVITNNTATELKVKNTDDDYVIAFVYNASVDTLSRDEIINSVVIKELRYSNVNLTEYVDSLKNDLSDNSHLILGFNKDGQYYENNNCRMYFDGTNLFVQTSSGGNLLEISGATLLV